MVLTLSSAAAFKLRHCGILLRSKTTKTRLKSCPVERSGTMLQRLVRDLYLFQIFLAQPTKPYFQAVLICKVMPLD